MSTRDDDIHLRPGRIRHGNQGAKRPKSFVGEVMRAAKKAGHTGEGLRADRRNRRADRPSGGAGGPPCLCPRARLAGGWWS